MGYIPVALRLGFFAGIIAASSLFSSFLNNNGGGWDDLQNPHHSLNSSLHKRCNAVSISLLIC